MRTPPPVLPPDDESATRYQPSLLERLGPDGPLIFRARVISVASGLALFPTLLAYSPRRAFTSHHPLLSSFVGAIAGGFAMYWIQTRTVFAAGAAARTVHFPDGSHTPYEEQYSFQESLVAKGDMAAAMEAYERVIADQPGRAAPRLRAAEHYAGRARDPRRAAELFREVRDLPGVTARDAVYASSRLVDLYDGPLGEPGRALVELRRIIERYPGSAVATHARTVLPALKAQLAGEAPGGLPDGSEPG